MQCSACYFHVTEINEWLLFRAKDQYQILYEINFYKMNFLLNEFASEILYVLRDTYEGLNNIKSKNWDCQERFRNSVLDDA